MTSIIEILEIVGGLIGIIAIIIVIWDHFKDDRLLTRNVQEFYEDIENLIKVYLNQGYHLSHQDESYQQKGLEFLGQYNYYKAKVKQQFEEFSKYLGLTLSEGKTHGNQKIAAYMIGTGEKLLEDGNITFIHTSQQERLVFGSPSSSLREEEIEKLNSFLSKLRITWKVKYYKRFFRPKLKSTVNFLELTSFKKPR